VIVDGSRLITGGGEGEDGGGVGVDECAEWQVESGDEVPHGCRAAGKTRSSGSDLPALPVL
jgi:hypothetical protein